MFFQKGCNNDFVFFRFNTADRVYQNAVGFNQRGQIFEKAFLNGGMTLEIRLA